MLYNHGPFYVFHLPLHRKDFRPPTYVGISARVRTEIIRRQGLMRD